MAKCLNCGTLIRDEYDTCCKNCAEEYFYYVFKEKLEDHPEFDSRIQPKE